MFDGTVIRLTKEDDGMLLRTACVEALVGQIEKESLSGVDSVKRYKFGMAIHDSQEPIEVSSEQIAELKNLLAKRWPVIIAGQAAIMLEEPWVAPVMAAPVEVAT